MAKRDVYTDEVRRPERILFLVAGIATPAWIAISLAFFPDALLEGVLIGVIFTVLFLGIGFVVVMGRYWAPKAVFTNDVMELTNPQVIHLEPPPFMMPAGVEHTPVPFPEAITQKLDEAARTIRPGYNEFGQLVPWGAMRLGGWRIGKSEQWQMAGKDGILLLVGNAPFVECYENRIFPCGKVLVRHEEVDREILKQLKAATGGWFIPFDPAFKLYRTTEIDAAWANYFRRNGEVKANVLDEMDLNGLVEEMIAMAGRDGHQVDEPQDATSFEEFKGLLSKWLEKKGTAIDRDLYGPATAATAWALVRGLQARNSQLSVDLDIAQGHETDLRATLRGQDRREAMMYSGSRSATAQPQEVTDQLDNIQGYRSRDVR
jgi:hypothetical protein